MIQSSIVKTAEVLDGREIRMYSESGRLWRGCILRKLNDGKGRCLARSLNIYYTSAD